MKIWFFETEEYYYIEQKDGTGIDFDGTEIDIPYNLLRRFRRVMREFVEVQDKINQLVKNKQQEEKEEEEEYESDYLYDRR